jgi:hypothetical protein
MPLVREIAGGESSAAFQRVQRRLEVRHAVTLQVALEAGPGGIGDGERGRRVAATASGDKLELSGEREALIDAWCRDRAMAAYR